MSIDRSSILEEYRAYWACVAILMSMMVYFILRLAFTPSSSLADVLEIAFLFLFIAFAPGTFSVIAALIALAFIKRPSLYLRIGTYFMTAFYAVVFVIYYRDFAL